MKDDNNLISLVGNLDTLTQEDGKIIRQTGTYKRLVEIIPLTALDNLPDKLEDILGYEFISVLYLHLLLLVDTGISYFAYNPSTKSFIYFSQIQRTRAMSGENTYIDTLTQQRINNEYVFDLSDNSATINTAVFKTIYLYERLLEIMIGKENKSLTEILKLFDYANAIKTGNTQRMQGYLERIKGFINRKSGSVSVMDSSDEFQQLQFSFSNVAISEVKEKLALESGIPYSKLFKGASSGYGKVEEEETRQFNVKVGFFTVQHILPYARQYCHIIKKMEEFNKIKVQPPSITDKKLLAEIQKMRIDSAISLFSLDAITSKELTEIVNNNLINQ